MTHANCGLRSVQINNLYVSNQDLPVLKGLNLTVHCGEFLALIGRNGAGKTTLLRALLSECPYKGKVSFYDDRGLPIAKPQIGYVPQNIALDKSSPVTVADFFAAAMSRRPAFLGCSKGSKEKAEALLARVDAAHLLNRRLGALSGGELQRVMLAFALQPVPSLLLLDEPMTGVDGAGLSLFYEIVAHLLEQYHTSIIMVSHDLRLVAEYADTVAFLDDGKIELCGPPQTVFQNPSVLDAFGRVLQQ